MNSNVIKQLGFQMNNQVDHADQASATAGGSYKFSVKIETLDGQNGSVKPTTFDEWQLEGCFISQVQYGDLNYADSNMVQVTLTIRYDHAAHVIKGDDVLSGAGPSLLGNGATDGGSGA